jgi:hypothetical protein
MHIENAPIFEISKNKNTPSKFLLKGCFVGQLGIKKFEILLAQRFYLEVQ